MEQKSDTTITLEALVAGLAKVATHENRITALENRFAELARNKIEESKPLIPKGRKWVKIKEAAQVLGVSVDTVRRYIDRKLLSRNLATRHVLIPAEELEKFGGRVMVSY